MDFLELLDSYDNDDDPIKDKVCPICGLSLVQTHFDTHNHCFVLEEILECPANHYIFEFAYGSEREYIGERELDWWRFSDKDYKERELKRQELISIAKDKI